MKRINLRLDDDLHARLKESAEQDDRSMQQQIVWLLKGALSILKEQK
jgi:hypothetical protein